jgi:hypothetical protein
MGMRGAQVKAGALYQPVMIHAAAAGKLGRTKPAKRTRTGKLRTQAAVGGMLPRYGHADR